MTRGRWAALGVVLGLYALMLAAMPRPGATLIGALAYLSLVLGLYGVVRLRARAIVRNVTERFTVRLDKDALTCAGSGSPEVRVPLADIAEILGGKRVSVVTQDARTIVLPFALDEAKHADLASELNAELRSLRAEAGGYRGPRLEEEEEDAQEEGNEKLRP